MSKKSARRKPPTGKRVSPLLGALVRDVAPSAHPDILKAFLALDAFRRGQGTGGLFVELAQLFVVSEKLCDAAYLEAKRPVNEAAIAAINALNDRYAVNENDNWKSTEAEYAAMRAGVELLDQQLSLASNGDYRIAESLMARYVLSFYGDEDAEGEPEAAKI